MLPPEQILAAFMFAGMIVFLFAGFPVAFSLTFTGIFFGGLGVLSGLLRADFFDILPIRIWGTMTNYTLLAVPLFVFMGVVLEKSGLAEELLETMALLFGKMRGGIAISVVVVGAILAASTGIVGASVITMGLVSLPTMLRRGYHKELICGTICASGTLGQIIPPSVILVLLGDIMGVSVGDLYIGAVLPGLLLVALYIIYIAILGRLRPELAPAIPEAELAVFRGDALKRVTIALIPAFALIVAVLGAIFAGVATPTEAASVGAVGGILLTMIKRKFTWGMLRNVMEATTRITSLAFIILVGANCFGLVFRGLNGDHLIQDFLKSLPLGPYGVLAVVMFVIFLLGFFIDPHPGAGHALRLRSALARGRHRRQSTDVVPHPALRLRALLPARGGAAGDQDDGHLPRRGAVRGAAADRPDDHDRIPADRPGAVLLVQGVVSR